MTDADTASETQVYPLVSRLAKEVFPSGASVTAFENGGKREVTKPRDELPATFSWEPVLDFVSDGMAYACQSESEATFGLRKGSKTIHIAVFEEPMPEGDLALPEAPCGDGWTYVKGTGETVDGRTMREDPWNRETWNDATVIGPRSKEFDDLMRQEVSVALGNQYTEYVEKKPSSKSWPTITGTWAALAEGSKAYRKNNYEAWGLTRHVEGDRKDGMSYVFGDCSAGKRRLASMREMEAIALDLDDSCSVSEVLESASALGYSFFLYTSYNHLRSSDTAKREAVQEYGEEITTETLRTYLKDKAPSKPWQSAVLVDPEEDSDGELRVRYSHDPIEKMRIVFPLAAPVNVNKARATEKASQELWKAKVRGMAQMLNVHHDASGESPQHFFFTARHRPGDSNYECYVHRGRPVPFEDIPEVADEVYETRKSKSKKPDRVTAMVDGEEVDVTALYARYGKRWDIADILEDANVAGSCNGKFQHVLCPNHEEHSNHADGMEGSAYVINAGESEKGFAIFNCDHNHCSGVHLTHALASYLESGDITREELENPSFMLPVERDEGKYLRLTPTEVEAREEAREYFRRDPDADPEAMVRKIHENGMDLAYAKKCVDEARDAGAHDLTPSPSPVLADLHDPDLVENGWVVKWDEHPDVYKRYEVSRDESGYKKLVEIAREQIREAMRQRFSYVVSNDGARLAICNGRGRAIDIAKEENLTSLFRNRVVKYSNGDGCKVIKPNAEFLEDPVRPTYVGTCFEPDPAKDTGSQYNIWTGFAVAPRPGDWSLLRDHIHDNVCDGDKRAFDWLMTWLASTFARPGVKIPSSVAVIGEQGTGKSKVFDWVREAIGVSSLKVSAGQHLSGKFNAHLDGKLFLAAEEAFWAGDKQAAGVLKDLITSQTLQIEGKFKDLVERPNYVAAVFISNNKWVVPTDGKDARRFLVLRCSEARKQDSNFFAAIDHQMKSGGVEAMVHDLTYWKPEEVGLTWQSLRYPPDTAARREQSGLGLSGPKERLVDALETGELQGITKGGERFGYTLHEDEPTRVAVAHMKAVLNGTDKGNINGEMKDAIAEIIGAKQSDAKAAIEYINPVDDEPVRMTERVRYYEIPALNDLRPVLAEYGRG